MLTPVLASDTWGLWSLNSLTLSHSVAVSWFSSNLWRCFTLSSSISFCWHFREEDWSPREGSSGAALAPLAVEVVGFVPLSLLAAWSLESALVLVLDDGLGESPLSSFRVYSVDPAPVMPDICWCEAARDLCLFRDPLAPPSWPMKNGEALLAIAPSWLWSTAPLRPAILPHVCRAGPQSWLVLRSEPLKFYAVLLRLPCPELMTLLSETSAAGTTLLTGLKALASTIKSPGLFSAFIDVFWFTADVILVL